MLELKNRVRHSGLEQNLLGLVKIRACQVLGCVTCFGMHIRDATARGESQERIRLLDSWREASCYSEREQAALAWTEALTRVSDAGCEALQALWAGFDNAGQVEVALLIETTGSWNRAAIRHAPDEDYAALEAHFTEEEQIKLTLLISMIKTWDRLTSGLQPVGTLSA
jgi:AhpD family alkylhydroperoxidase